VDAESAIRIRPKWPKAYTRRAAAHHLLGDYDRARGDYEKAMELDPNDMSLVQVRQNCFRRGLKQLLGREGGVWLTGRVVFTGDERPQHGRQLHRG
jgi:tetratricopeptide (TPR) repeat protein